MGFIYKFIYSPDDSRGSRFLKKIYVVSMSFGSVLCGIISLTYALLNDWTAFYGWITFTVIAPLFLMLAVLFPRGIEWIGFFTQTWMVVWSFGVAVVLGGFLLDVGC